MTKIFNKYTNNIIILYISGLSNRSNNTYRSISLLYHTLNYTSKCRQTPGDDIKRVYVNKLAQQSRLIAPNSYYTIHES